MESSFSSNNNNNRNEPVQLGFAEIPRKGDLDLENFPSKIGGLPIWLLPFSNNIDESFFICSCGENLCFLLQLYTPLEDKNNCFHRMLYVFFCQKCWKKKDLVKVLRINLPEKSSFYDGEEILNKKIIFEDEKTKKINEKLKNFVLDEYFITTAQEKKEASKLYFDFYNNAEEKSVTSNDNSINQGKYEEEEEIIINNNKEEKEYNDVLKKYLKENPNVNIEKIEDDSDDEKDNDNNIDSHEDIIMSIFTNVTNYDKKQIIRYYRNNFYPLWFTQDNMLTIKNTKCKNCCGNVIFEFQIMPYLFLIEPKIAFNDIGTIVIYTCQKCCDTKYEGGFVEEYGFIQRTGENFTDLKDNENYNKNRNKKLQNKTDKIIEENEFFAGVNEKDADEEGFVEVKKKKNKKHHKKNKDDDDEKE